MLSDFLTEDVFREGLQVCAVILYSTGLSLIFKNMYVKEIRFHCRFLDLPRKIQVWQR